MILVAYGTRPEWIKLSVLIEYLRKKTEVCVLYTGQQKDIGNFGYDRSIVIKQDKNRLNDIVSSILDSDVFDGISHVIVQGDTASAFAVALSAFNLGIPISHVEAGLRTYDSENPYPEESYRQMISCLASYHYCPTEKDRENLIAERKNGKIFTVGNTVIDTLPIISTAYDNKVLVTMHRRENIPMMKEWFTAVEELAIKYQEIDFILPLHPNPLVKEAASCLKYTKIVPPMNHDELLNLMAKCKCIISDSGGIQEEASFYQKKVLVCRKTTERPAKNQILVQNPTMLKGCFEQTMANHIVDDFCPFGNGDASEKIYEIMIMMNHFIK